MRQLINLYLPTFLDEEIPRATAAFSQAIADLTAPYLADPECRSLLQYAAGAFPLSSALAQLLARSLYVAGEIAQSHQYDARAHALRQIALTRNAEFPSHDGSIHFGQFSRHINSVLNKKPE